MLLDWLDWGSTYPVDPTTARLLTVGTEVPSLGIIRSRRGYLLQLIGTSAPFPDRSDGGRIDTPTGQEWRYVHGQSIGEGLAAQTGRR